MCLRVQHANGQKEVLTAGTSAQGLDAARLVNGGESLQVGQSVLICSWINLCMLNKMGPCEATGILSRMMTVQSGARGPQTDLMESYVKEQRHDDAERDSEM